MNKQKKSKSGVINVLSTLAIVGVLLIIYRLLAGLGRTTNLSDGYAWGLWIGVDIMAGIAMTTGGLTVAALVLVFGRKKYEPLLKPALLTAFLGYILEIIGLVPDLGRPWMLWSAIINWNNASVMFLVAWCVIIQAIVLTTIFAPLVFEKLKWTKLQSAYDSMVPFVSVLIATFFIYLVSGAAVWALITFITFLIIMIVLRATVGKKSLLLLLAITGIIVSVSHQTALGALFILVPEKLSWLWYSPYMQANFLVTAFALGLAMLIFESSLSAKAFGFGLEKELITGIANKLVWLLLVSVILRFVTLYKQTGFNLVDAGSGVQNFSFWLEVIVGLILPLIFLLMPASRKSAKAAFNISCMVIFGVILNRINVAWIGIDVPGYSHYYPGFIEILITLGIFSIGILAFYNIGKRFPIFSHE